VWYASIWHITFYKCNLAQPLSWLANYSSTASALTVVGDVDSCGSHLPKHGAGGMGLSLYYVQQQLAVGHEWYVRCLEPFQSKLSSQLEPISFKCYLCWYICQEMWNFFLLILVAMLPESQSGNQCTHFLRKLSTSTLKASAFDLILQDMID
jgi:hypothetical protein